MSINSSGHIKFMWGLVKPNAMKNGFSPDLALSATSVSLSLNSSNTRSSIRGLFLRSSSVTILRPAPRNISIKYQNCDVHWHSWNKGPYTQLSSPTYTNPPAYKAHIFPSHTRYSRHQRGPIFKPMRTESPPPPHIHKQITLSGNGHSVEPISHVSWAALVTLGAAFVVFVRH